MSSFQVTRTQWSKSFPTTITSSICTYTCKFEHGRTGKPCAKVFLRKCDLHRHEKNHTRPSRCKECKKGFPASKDLERHINSVHNNTIKYFCCYEWCRDALKPENGDFEMWGFRRKDHWQKHMKKEHHSNSNEVRTLEQLGIPIAVLKDGKWIAVIRKGNELETIELSSSATEGSKGDGWRKPELEEMNGDCER